MPLSFRSPRSVPLLEEMELLASSGLIVGIIGTLEKGPNPLRALTVTAAEKRPGEEEDTTSEEPKGIVAAGTSQRPQGFSTR